MKLRSALFRIALSTGALTIAPSAFAQTSTPPKGKADQTQILDNTVTPCPAGQVSILDNTVRPGTPTTAVKSQRSRVKTSGGNAAILDNTVKPVDPASNCRPAPLAKP